MALAPRHIAIFGTGLVIGVAGAWLAFGSHFAPSAPKPTIPIAATPSKKEARAARLEEAPPPLTAVMGAGPQRATCGSGLLVAGGAGDGQIRLVADVSTKTAGDAAALILAGKEAAASGHARDAEAAFLSACRIAARAKGEESVEYADAKYQLGRHYANIARSGDRGANRQELAGRAEQLYTDSLQTYLARYGEGHEKSRFAMDGLAGLRENVAQGRPASAPEPVPAKPATPPVKIAAAPARLPAAPAAPVPAPAPAPTIVAVAPARSVVPLPAVASATAKPRPMEIAPDGPREMRPLPAVVANVAPPAPMPLPRAPVARVAPPPRVEAAPEIVSEAPVRQARGSATADVRPSFDCAKARSPSEKLICSDSELAQLDRNLGRLHARAKNSTSDGAAFKRHNEAEWRRRESTCRGDRECLLDWYAQRREQLLNEVE